MHAMPFLSCRGLPWVRSVARATDWGSGCFAGAPRGRAGHGTVVRGVAARLRVSDALVEGART